jgi:hypothetical protein
MKRIFKYIDGISLSFSFFATAMIAAAYPVYAQTKAWSGVCVGGPDNDVATIQGLQCVVANVLSIAITGIGLAGFVMLIVGAFKYLLSGGNAKGADDGKNTMTFAVIGLVVALSAFIILRILAEFTGVRSILNFTIPNSQTNF